MRKAKGICMLTIFCLILSTLGACEKKGLNEPEILKEAESDHKEQDAIELQEESDSSTRTIEDEAIKEPLDEKEYLLPDYSFRMSDSKHITITYYDGYYYFISPNNELCKYSDDTNTSEVLFTGVIGMVCVDNVLYCEHYISETEYYILAYPLDGREKVDDISNGLANYATRILWYNDDYLMFDSAKEQSLAVDFHLVPLLGKDNLETHNVTELESVMDFQITEDAVFFAWTDDEYAEEPPLYYKKYDFATKEIADISKDEIPDEFVYSSFHDAIVKAREKYSIITGVDGAPFEVYHDHLFYKNTKLIDDEFVETIQIYDCSNIIENEIKGPNINYIGCANGCFMYLDDNQPVLIQLD